MIPSPRPQYRGRRLALTAGALLLPLALMAPASPAGATTTSPAGPAVGKDAAAALPDGPAAGRAEARRFPRPGNTGVPRDWQPRRTYYEDRIISRPGAVVQNIRLVEADLVINAPDVTVTNVEIVGGRITNFAGPTCQNGLLVTRTTFRRAADGDGAPDPSVAL